MFDLGTYEYLEDENLALLRAAPSGQRILDVGCGAGVLGEHLRRRGNTVWGIDSAPEAAEPAAKRLDRFVLGDVTDPASLSDELDGQVFDVLVFADVLEHLPDPIGTLRAYRAHLAPGGRLLVSVPNVAVWYVRFALLVGRFDYAPTGTLDHTHLRFFTRRTLTRALHEAGFTITSSDVNPGLARVFVGLLKRLTARGGTGDRRALLDSPLYRAYLRLVHPWELWLARRAPGLLAFQYVVTAEQERRP